MIIAARNPGIRPSVLSINLGPELGVDASAAGLVLEKTYPYHWISPRLTGCGQKIELPLQGFETAIYELYPLEAAALPLLADAVFEVDGWGKKGYEISVLDTGPDLKLLNRDRIRGMDSEGRPVDPGSLNFKKELSAPVLEKEQVFLERGSGGYEITVDLELNDCLETGFLAVLYENPGADDSKNWPRVQAAGNGQDLLPGVEEQKGKWMWIRIPVSPGLHSFKIGLIPLSVSGHLDGELSVWLIASRHYPATPLRFLLSGDARSPAPPPRPWPKQTLKEVIKLKAFGLPPGG